MRSLEQRLDEPRSMRVPLRAELVTRRLGRTANFFGSSTESVTRFHSI